MPAAHLQLHFPGNLAGFERAASDLRSRLDDHALDGQYRHNIELAFEEIAINIVRHGSTNEDIRVAVDIAATATTMTFEDDGVSFDPTARPTPELPNSIDEAAVGGLGVMLVRSVTSSMTYERTSDRNRLTLVIPA